LNLQTRIEMLNDSAAAPDRKTPRLDEENDQNEQNGGQFHEEPINPPGGEQCLRNGEQCSKQSNSFSFSGAEDDQGKSDDWLEKVLEKMKDVAKKCADENVNRDDFVAVGVGIRFLDSKKEVFLGKYIDSKFLDLVVDIINTHLKLSYYSGVNPADGIKLTIRNSRHVIYSTTEDNFLTVIAFANLKMASWHPSLKFFHPVQPSQFTIPEIEEYSVPKHVVYNPNWMSAVSPLTSCSPISSALDVTSGQHSFLPSTMTPSSVACSEENGSQTTNLVSNASSSISSLSEVRKSRYDAYQGTNFYKPKGKMII